MYGGATYGGTTYGGVGSATTSPGADIRLAADAASTTDWDLEVVSPAGSTPGGPGPAQPDSATATESVPITTGLGPPPTPGPSTSTSVIRWVDSVSPTAGVRMDLENSYWTVRFHETSTPTPQMEDQRSSSMLADGELISASVYKNRTVHLNLLLKAPTASIAASEVQRLQRELDRDGNVLMWQPDDRLPAVYFRTYRGPDVTADLDFGLVLYQFQIAIEAEPFALGERVDLGSRTVSFDPTAASNPCYFDLTGIKGDVDTPLYLTTSDTKFNARQVAIATRRRGTQANMRWYRQAEDLGLTLGTDAVRMSASDTSSGNAVRVSFATTATNVLRLSGTFPSNTEGSADWAGTYRVFARMRTVVGTVDVQLATGTTAASRNQPVTVNSSYSNFDLGLVRLPVANPGRNAGYGPAHAVGGSTLYLYMEAPGGVNTANLDTDYVFLCPADEDYAFVQMPAISGGSGVILDGVNGDVYCQNQNGELSTPGTVVPYADGELPSVSPTALVNRVFVLNAVNGQQPGPTAISATMTFDTVSYWPRYLLVRPVTT